MAQMKQHQGDDAAQDLPAALALYQQCGKPLEQEHAGEYIARALCPPVAKRSLARTF